MFDDGVDLEDNNVCANSFKSAPVATTIVSSPSDSALKSCIVIITTFKLVFFTTKIVSVFLDLQKYFSNKFKKACYFTIVIHFLIQKILLNQKVYQSLPPLKSIA